MIYAILLNLKNYSYNLSFYDLNIDLFLCIMLKFIVMYINCNYAI